MKANEYRCKYCSIAYTRDDHADYISRYDPYTYCSLKCYNKDKSNAKKYPRKCLYCGKKFETIHKNEYYCKPRHRALNLQKMDGYAESDIYEW